MGYLTLEEKRKKFGVGIWTVLDFFKIEIPDKDNFYIPCQNCGDFQGKGRKTLNINIPKESFRCPRCDISGGYVDLFSLYFHGRVIPGYKKKDMMRDMRENNFDNFQVSQSRRNFANFKVEPEVPLVDINGRDFVYNELLDSCVLCNEDLNDLRRRGLSDKAISMLGYKSTTVTGPQIALQMRQRGLPLKGVPGFYRDEKNFQWNVNNYKGYYIPYRNVDGQIEGMQIRTNFKDCKYIWLSSVSKKDGVGAKTWSHFAQTFTCKDSRSDTFILTEGGLKGDIINYFTGIDVVAMPGVNTLSELGNLLDDLQARGYKKVLTAFDMDFLSNKFVLQGYNKLLNFLDSRFDDITVLNWDSNYNGKETEGLDDYLYEVSKKVNLFKGREHLVL